MKQPTRTGAVLLEVLVAMTILAVGCVMVLGATNEIVSNAIHVAGVEAEVMRADQFMGAVSIWPRSELDRHLGAHRRGEWVLEIQRPDPSLYEVTIMDSISSRAWLRTTLYSPSPMVAP